MSKENIFNLIKTTFHPSIAVFCSPDVNNVCLKNQLTFVEILKPFSRLTCEGSIKDSNNLPHSLNNFNVSFHDINETQPNNIIIEKEFYSIVTDSIDHNIQNILNLSTEDGSPWFDAFKVAYLKFRYPTNYDYLYHYLACIYVVSTSNVDAVAQADSMIAQQVQMQSSNLGYPYFSSNILRYFILLNDAQDCPIEIAERCFEIWRTKFGQLSSHLLTINSQTENSQPLNNIWQFYFSTNQPSSEQASMETLTNSEDIKKNYNHIIESSSNSHPLSENNESIIDPSQLLLNFEYKNKITERHPTGNIASLLSNADQDRLRKFVNDFICNSLVPWAEKTIKMLTEQISSRKGLRSSLFGATSKWFSRGKQASLPSANNSHSANVFGSDSLEMQMRRLGDLLFHFEMYDSAFQIYHALKKEFNTSSAWAYYAAALEMASLSAYLTEGAIQRQYPLHYMDIAIRTYLNPCKMNEQAIRTMLLGCQILTCEGLHTEANNHYMLITAEESDLKGGLLLEQAALCFLRMKQQPMFRKFAFHIVLAGHRFNKAGQKKHVIRCYNQALKIFKNKQWFLAEDHINLTMASHYMSIGIINHGISSFQSLLSLNSQQPANQQTIFFNQFLNAYKVQNNDCLLELSIPIVNQHSIEIATRKISRELLENNVFNELEVKLKEKMFPSDLVSNILSSQFLTYNERTNNCNNIPIVVKEQSIVFLNVSNPLKIGLTMLHVQLMWKFINEDGQIFTNNPYSSFNQNLDNIIEEKVLEEFFLDALETKQICLEIICNKVGTLEIQALMFKLTSPNHSQHLISKGNSFSMVNDTIVRSSKNQQQTIYSIAVPQNASHKNKNELQETYTFFIHGKISLSCRGVRLHFTKHDSFQPRYSTDKRLHWNILHPMPKLHISCLDVPSTMLCGQICNVNFILLNCGTRPLHNLYIASSCTEFFIHLQIGQLTVELNERVHLIEPLEQGNELIMRALIRCPVDVEKVEVSLLFCYQSVDLNPSLCYRSERFKICLIGIPSLNMTKTCQRMFIAFPTTSSQIQPNKNLNRNKNNIFNEQININFQLNNLCISNGLHLQILQAFALSHHFQIIEQSMKQTDDQFETIMFNLNIQKVLDDTKQIVSYQTYTENIDDMLILDSWKNLNISDKLFTNNSNNCNNMNFGETIVYPNYDILYIAIIWKMSSFSKLKEENQNHYGLHFVKIIQNFQPDEHQMSLDRNNFTGKQLLSNEDPLSILFSQDKNQIDYNFEIQSPFVVHNFINKKHCVVELNIIICNYGNENVNLKLKCQHSKESFQLSHRWVGITSKQIHLPHNQLTSIPLKCLFPAPGVYNISNINLQLCATFTNIKYNNNEQVDSFIRTLKVPTNLTFISNDQPFYVTVIDEFNFK